VTCASSRRRVAAIGALAVLPSTVLLVGNDVVTLVFLPGLVDYNPAVEPAVRLLPLWEIVAAGGALPRNPDLWPVSLVVYCLALASACAGQVRDENAGLTAGFLVLPAVTHLGVAYAFLHRLASLPLPVGPVVAVALAWWYYWPALRTTLRVRPE
jgi:uncharacterized protein (TIGR04206 family)